MVFLTGLLIFQESSDQVSLMTKLLAASVIALGALIAGLLLVRKMFREVREQAVEQERPRAKVEEVLALATFQGVMQKMREQEKELERLRRAERQRVHDSQQLSATIMRNMATGLVILNTQGIITESNPAANSVLGHQLLVGRSFREVFWPEAVRAHEPAPPVIANMETCLSTGQAFRRNTFSYTAPQGEIKVLGVGLSPILTEGQVSGVICLLSDLTEITALQQEVRLKENLAALGEMAAGIAHEFKNSLATIAGYAQLIPLEENLDGVRQHAKKIVGETQFLTQIVTDFLNFSRPLSLVAADVPIRELVENVFAEVSARGEGPGVELEMRGEFPTISADQTLLRQCFANLLRNGCEAIVEAGRPGKILVESQVEPGQSGPVVRIRVTDNGTGIAPANLDKVFIPFFTTKNAGTGLGLALVHKIIVNHNGKIEVSSEEGKGTAFTVTLPLAGGAVLSAGRA